MQNLKYTYVHISNISYLYCKIQIHKSLELKNTAQYFIESSRVQAGIGEWPKPEIDD